MLLKETMAKPFFARAQTSISTQSKAKRIFSNELLSTQMLTSPQFHRKVQSPLAVHSIPLETSQVPWQTRNWKGDQMTCNYFTCFDKCSDKSTQT